VDRVRYDGLKLQQAGGHLGLMMRNHLGVSDSKALGPYCILSKPDPVLSLANRAFGALCYMASKGYFRPHIGLFRSCNLHVYRLSSTITVCMKALCCSLHKNKLVLSL